MNPKNFIEITNWAKESLLTKGIALTEPPETIQTTPWSSVTRLTTTKGYIYLKQTLPALALEPTITQILHDQFQASVPLIISINKELNSFLIADAGKPLRESLKHNFQPGLLYQAIKKYTAIQEAVKGEINTFLSLGVPDWSLEKLPSLYEKLVVKKDLLKIDGMMNNELNLLHELAPKFSSMCKLLATLKISETLDHCDFHDNNVLIESNTNNLTIIDWGEIVITHPFFSLLTCLNTVTRHYSLKETDQAYIYIQNTCFANWQSIIPKDDLLDAIHLTKKLWPVYAALGLDRLIMSTGEEKHKSIANKLTRYFREFIRYFD